METNRALWTLKKGPQMLRQLPCAKSLRVWANPWTERGDFQFSTKGYEAPNAASAT